MTNPFQQVIYEEELSEGRPSQRHPLEGHDYHKKTDAQLEYIAKDAHKAAEAMKSHDTDAENKYRDQANDSATVRYWRKKNGMPDWYKKKYGHMKEEVELDEVSQDALINYFKKSVADLSKRQIKMNTGSADSNDAKKMQDRKRGLSRASDKIAAKMEETEQIDELSKDTLKSYKHKAGQDARAHSSASLKAFKQGDEEKGDAHFNKSYKRVIGVAKAIDKLQNKGVKEEAEITEAKGALTYKPEHAKWGVVPKSSKEFVKFFPKDKEADAKAHAEKTGGILKKIDQAGRAMREETELSEAKIPVEHAVKAATRVLGSQSAARFATHLRPGTEKHTSWDKVNDALKKQGVKPKHIADIAVHVRPAQYEEAELDEASDTKRPPNFTMHPIDRQDYKILKDPKKKSLPKDSKEWGRDGGEKKMKEEVELDEVSMEKLQKYFAKGVKDLSNREIRINTGKAAADDAKKSQDRKRGLTRAAEKIGAKMEEVDLDEAISVEHDRYMRSHGKKASGTGTWMFTHKRAGDVDYKNDKEVHQARGSFSDAAKSAKAWAKSHGHSTVYVMEEVELDENQVWKGHSSTVKNPNFNDELSIRRVNPVGKRLKSGKLSADEKGSQERLKSLMKFKREKGGLTGPQGTLPEEVELDESGFADDFLKMVQKRHPQAKLTTGAEKKKEAEDLMKKRVASGAKPVYPHPGPDKHPLGGYDPVSKRSYSEETESDSSKLLTFNEFISK